MSSSRSYRLPLLLCGCGAVASALIFARELSARQSLADFEALRTLYSATDNYRVLGAVSLLAGVTLTAAAGLRGRAPALLSRLRTASSALWLALLLIASAGYFYGSRGTSTPYFPWLWDSFHYVLGAKYHRELGYHALYDCAVQADRESRHVLPARGVIRDLASYRLVPIEDAMRRPCHALFSAPRWEQFKRDLTIFQRQTRGYFSHLLRDFGFNGTPVHAIVAGELFSPPELTFENVARLTVIDVLTAALTMAVIALCFGEPLGAVCALFMLVNVADRFAHIGGSYFRYLWLLLLAGGVSLLKLGRYRGAGACFACATTLNVFPLLFAAGPLARLLSRHEPGSPLRAQRRDFALSLGLSLTGLWLASLALGSSLARYADFFAKMWLHIGIDNPERVGFKYLFFAPIGPPFDAVGEVSIRHLPDDAGGFAIALLGALAIAALAALCTRLDDVEASVLGGVGLLFFALSTVQYYYAGASLLPLAFHRRLHDRGAQLLLGGFFVANAAVYGLLFTDYAAAAENIALSWLFGACTCGTALYLAARVRRRRSE